MKKTFPAFLAFFASMMLLSAGAFAQTTSVPPSIPDVSVDSAVLAAAAPNPFAFLSITGAPATVTVGDTVTPLITLVAPTSPDSDFSDGTISKLFGATFVANEQGTVLQQNPEVELSTSTFAETVVFTTTTAGNFIVGGIIIETTNTYDFGTNTWAGWTTPVIVVQEDVNFEALSPTAPAPTAPTFDLGQIFSDFFGSIISGFCSLFGFTC